MRGSLTALALVVLISTACTASGPPSAIPSSWLTAGSQPSHQGTIALTWQRGGLPGVDLTGGRAVLVSATLLVFPSSGSSNCPSLPTSLQVLNPSAIQMNMADYIPPTGGCFLDLTNYTVEVAIDPALVNVFQSLNIQLVFADGGGYTLVAPGLT